MEPHDDLLDALTPVVRTFERLGVAYLVGGSVASAAHGEFRATNDVDLVADLARITHEGSRENGAQRGGT